MEPFPKRACFGYPGREMSIERGSVELVLWSVMAGGEGELSSGKVARIDELFCAQSIYAWGL
jgi:hypothetical protein